MRFTETPIPGLTIIDLDRRGDDRGYFARVWCVDELTEAGLDPSLVQANMSTNGDAGTTRGLHYQHPPHGENKLIRCIQGSVWDVGVDLRPDSETYLQWFGTELSYENGRALFVPKGFAHGYQTLTDDAAVLYFVSDRYAPDHEDGLRWDDPDIGIEWPLEPTVMSPRDQQHPLIAERTGALL